jgi:hypothetical protein
VVIAGDQATADTARYLFATSLVFYALWLLMFDYYRYALVLYILIPLLTAFLVIGLPVSRMTSAAAVGFLFAAALTSKGDNWGRIPWTDKFVEAAPDELKLTSDPSKTLLVLLNSGGGYIITLLPTGVSAVQLDEEIAPREPADLPWNVRRHAMIDRPWEAMYGVSFAGFWTADMREFLESFKLTAELSTCRILKTNLAKVQSPDDKPVFCKLERLKSGKPNWPCQKT